MSHVVKQNGSFSHTYTMTDAAGAALDLTGFTVTATARVQRHQSTTQSFSTTLDDPANGVVTIALTPTITGTMKVTTWDFDVRMESADTLTVYYTDTEELEVQDNITD